MDIKYVEVPIRVRPHTEYLDMKGVESLWEQIKEYVGEHSSQGSVNAEEVNAIIQAYYAAHRDELKGEPFTFEDLTEAQIEALRGAEGTPGRDGRDGIDGKDGRDGVDGTVSFDELTEEQRESLRGPQGIQGERGEQGLQGERGPKGADGTMTFSDLTDEQKESLKGDIGPQGPKGDTGDPFTYSMFTDEQLEALRGPEGKQGEKGERGEMGPAGPQGVQGIPGKQGEAAKVDYSLVYTRTEVDELLKTVDVNIDDINLENYYAKDETYNKEEVYNRGQIDNLISSLVIEGAAGVHIGDDEPTIAGVSVWVDTDGIPYEWEYDLTEVFYKKDYIDHEFEVHKHRLSEMENDIGFVTGTEAVPTKLSELYNDVGYVTTENVYKKPEVYNKVEILTTLADYWKKTDTLPADHVHMNKNILDRMYELNGNLMYNGMQLSGGGISDGSGGTIDLSPYALQANVNQQITTVSEAKVDKTTYNSKVNQIDTSLTSLDGRITAEAEARTLADNNLGNRITTIENKGYQTKADVQLLIANAGVSGGGEVNVDLTDYYTKSEVDNLIDNVEVDVSGLAAANHNHDSKYATVGHQHSNYAPSTHTHDYVTETRLSEAIAGLSSGDVDLTGYATETYVQQQIDAIEHPTTDLSNYYTKSGVNSLLANKSDLGHSHNYAPTTHTHSDYALKSEIPAAVDLTGYAKTTDIPDVSAFLTEEQVLALIQANTPEAVVFPQAEGVEF